MPLVSVILTSYNHASFLSMSIDSILSQSFKDFILYIVDDCSTDGSWSIIKSYSDHRIRAKRNPYNYGGGSIKSLIKEKEITTKYTAIAHSDDIWKPTKLEKQIKYMETHPDTSACFTNVELIDEENNPFNDVAHPYMNIFNCSNRTRFEWLNYFFYHGNCLCHPSLVIKTSAYDSFDLFPSGLSGLPDFCQWIRLCINGDLWVLDEQLTQFRIHKNAKNTSGNSPNQQKRLYIEDFLVLSEYLKIKSVEDFLKVFPDSQRFLIDKKINVVFAYSQILLGSNTTPQQKLFGIKLLYKLLNNEKDRQEILSLYNYDNHQFDIDKKKYDIFSLLPKSQIQHSSLYVDTNHGYSKNNQLKKDTSIDSFGNFQVSFDLTDYPKIRSLLFVPDEGNFRSYKIKKILISEPVDYKIIKNSTYSVNGLDYFFNTAPQYILEFNQTVDLRCVSFNGETELLDFYKCEDLIQNLEKQNLALSESNKEKNNKLNLLKTKRFSSIIKIVLNKF